MATPFIDLFTHKDGIDSKAYCAVLDLYDQTEQTFQMAFQAGKLMGVKILYFLDRQCVPGTHYGSEQIGRSSEPVEINFGQPRR